VEHHVVIQWFSEVVYDYGLGKSVCDCTNKDRKLKALIGE